MSISWDSPAGCKCREGRGHLCFCSQVYPQWLEQWLQHRTCSINIWGNEAWWGDTRQRFQKRGLRSGGTAFCCFLVIDNSPLFYSSTIWSPEPKAGGWDDEGFTRWYLTFTFQLGFRKLNLNILLRSCAVWVLHIWASVPEVQANSWQGSGLSTKLWLSINLHESSCFIVTFSMAAHRGDEYICRNKVGR